MRHDYLEGLVDCLGTPLEVGQVITWYGQRERNAFGYIKDIEKHQGSNSHRSYTIWAVEFEPDYGWSDAGNRWGVRGWEPRVHPVRARLDRLTVVPGISRYDLEQRFPRVREQAKT